MAGEHILVVEDEGIVAKDLQHRLSRCGYQVPTVVDTGQAAIDQVDADPPDLVLMDIMLKGDMEGTEAAEKIQKRFGIPIVYLTAYSDSATLDRAKSAEPFGYILKPFKEQELQSAIEIALSKHQAEQEKQRLQAQLARTKRMESVGYLSMGIAHNVNNALQTILGSIELARTGSPRTPEYLDVAKEGCLRISKLVEGLLLFSQQRPMKKQNLDICEVVRQAVEMCLFSFHQQIQIGMKGVDQPHYIFGDPGPLQQAMLNFCLNAEDALKDRLMPRLNIRIESVTTRAPESDTRADYVKISFRDNGVGMDQTVQEHIFDPFFTTKPMQQDTGMGLATTHSIIQAHGGWIDCLSQVNQGTTFEVYLPVTEQAEPG